MFCPDHLAAASPEYRETSACGYVKQNGDLCPTRVERVLGTPLWCPVHSKFSFSSSVSIPHERSLVDVDHLPRAWYLSYIMHITFLGNTNSR